MRYVFGILIVLHSLIHLLYSGQSKRIFELTSGMVWPDGSWAFTRLLGNEAARNLVSISLILAAIGLLAGGIGILINQAWWRPVIVGAAAFSSIIFLLSWNGKMQKSGCTGGSWPAHRSGYPVCCAHIAMASQ